MTTKHYTPMQFPKYKEGSAEAKIKYDAACKLQQEGDDDAAKSMFRQAAQGGHTGAAGALAAYACREHDEAEEIRWYRRKVELGDMTGAYYIGHVFNKRGEQDQAKHWWDLALESEDAVTRKWASESLRKMEGEVTAPARPKSTSSPAVSSSPGNVPPATVHSTPVPTLASPEQVLLDGIAAGQNLGGYSFSYAMGQLDIYVWQSTPRIGGLYQVGSLPAGEWFVIADRRGFLLPVAIQKVREHAYYVRVDPAPLHGLRTLTASS